MIYTFPFFHFQLHYRTELTNPLSNQDTKVTKTLYAHSKILRFTLKKTNSRANRKVHALKPTQ